MDSKISTATCLFVLIAMLVSSNPCQGSKQELYNGLIAQSRIFLEGRHMNKSIIPTEGETANEMTRFMKLMHSLTELHEQHQRLEALRDQNLANTELEALTFLTRRLSENACQVLTSKLGQKINCTYTELMKIKAKLELYFTTVEAISLIKSTDSNISNMFDTWLRSLACKVNDDGLDIIQSVKSRITRSNCVMTANQ